MNPVSALVIQPVLNLRIVADDLWTAVKIRQGAHQDLVERTDHGYRLNATHRRRYLFSGLLTCGACGGGYTITGNDRYGCANYRNRGTCGNGIVIKRRELEGRVLAGLKDKLMAPALVKEFVAAFHAEFNRRNHDAELGYDVSRRELADIGRKIDGILRAIEDGVYTSSTKDRLIGLEKRKAELEAIKPIPPTPRLHPNLADLYASKVARLEEALNEPDAREQAAEALRALVEGITLTPTSDGVLQIELYGELGAIFAIGQGANVNRPGDMPRRFSLVAGRGFEPLTFRL
jgi:site-specific DNA recombinase